MPTAAAFFSLVLERLWADFAALEGFFAADPLALEDPLLFLVPGLDFLVADPVERLVSVPEFFGAAPLERLEPVLDFFEAALVDDLVPVLDFFEADPADDFEPVFDIFEADPADDLEPVLDFFEADPADDLELLLDFAVLPLAPLAFTLDFFDVGPGVFEALESLELDDFFAVDLLDPEADF